MPAPADTLTRNWKSRITRAQELQDQHPAAKELLTFYAAVLDFQSSVSESVSQRADTSIALIEQIDFKSAASNLPRLLNIASKHGTASLAAAAGELRADESRWSDLMRSPADEVQGFFARACLQPIAEHLQVQFPVSTDESLMLCPTCGSLPQVVILRPEGEGARRSLLCCFCLREWGFRRVLCPSCGETDKEKLPYYTAAECKHVRVEACDSCLHYVKSVDLSLDGLADPMVDEVALSALDVWAFERGYQKVAKNLIGL